MHSIAEYRPVLEAAEENIAALENEIKTDVLMYGESHFRRDLIAPLTPRDAFPGTMMA